MLNNFTTLKKRQSFLDIRKQGFSISFNNLIFNFKKNINKNELGIFFYGITVSRKIGNAVKRNYFKRLIRALIIQNKSSLPIGYSVEIIPKKNSKPGLKAFQEDFDFFKNELVN